jgi:hypothetical protein
MKVLLRPQTGTSMPLGGPVIGNHHEIDVSRHERPRTSRKLDDWDGYVTDPDAPATSGAAIGTS